MSAVTVLRVDRPGLASQQGKTGTFNEMREGLLYVGQHPKVFALIVLSIVPFLFGMPLNTLLPAFNEDVLGGHADSLGLLISAMGAGAIIGSILMAGMGELRRKGLWLLLSCGVWGVLTALFGLTQSSIAALFVIAFIGLLSSWNMSLNRGMLQMTVDDHMRGRIMSIDMMSHGLMPLGVFPISWVAEVYGVGSALMVSGCVFVLLTILSFICLRSVRGLTKAPASA